ncbi:MAG: DUF362 domain-containing protein [Dehalococcoidales bacterium]|nr:DUF362 domain-containing protein [Dehalococcoidales bacterium]
MILERRDFIKGLAALGGLTFLAGFLPSCLRNRETTMTKISLVNTTDRAEGTRRAVDLLGINPVQGKAVVLKPNFNTADPAPGSTDIDTLRSLIVKLNEMGAKCITIAERSGPGPTTRANMEKKGVFDLQKELGFDIIDLQSMDRDGWVLVRPESSHWKEGFLFPKVYQDAESIVSTCCLKTHQFGGHFTLSLKNSVGMVPPGLGSGDNNYPYMNELHSSPHQRKMIAEINTAYSPDLIVLDGVEAFVDGGPHTGTRADANVILGGTDRVAIDAVGVAILRMLGTTPEVTNGKIFEQDQIARAAELGLGVTSADRIELVTDDAESAAYAEKVREILAQG